MTEQPLTTKRLNALAAGIRPDPIHPYTAVTIVELAALIEAARESVARQECERAKPSPDYQLGTQQHHLGWEAIAVSCKRGAALVSSGYQPTILSAYLALRDALEAER